MADEPLSSECFFMTGLGKRITLLILAVARARRKVFKRLRNFAIHSSEPGLTLPQTLNTLAFSTFASVEQ
jgi:hypothetical protein